MVLFLYEENMAELNVYQPWSAPVLHTALPDEILKELIQLTDIITKDEERESNNDQLVGEIGEEWTIDFILLTNISFKKYIVQLCWEYFKVLESHHLPQHVLHRLNNRVKKNRNYCIVV